MDLSPAQRDALLDVARLVIRRRVNGESFDSPICPDDPALSQPAGCFVSLHEIQTHRLRGCVGCMKSREALWRAVQESASAVLDDPRFQHCPVGPDDLSALELEVTILSPLRASRDALDFEPLEEGIYLTIAGQSACFLPQVARETGWSRQQLLDRLCTEKLNLPPGAWRQADAMLQKFTALILGPEPFG